MKTAFVTGCRSGFGRRLAQRLVEEGWTVHATDPTPPEDWEGGLPSGRGTVLAHRVDVRDPEQVRAATAALSGIPISIGFSGGPAA